MKISKILGIILSFAMILSLFSCNGDRNLIKNNDKSNSADKEQSNSQSDDSDHSIKYVYSITTKVIHKSDCHHVKRMNDDYKRELKGDPMDYLDDGYSLCKTCFPPAKDDTEPPEDVTDDPNAIKKEDATYVINTKTLKFHELDCYHADGMNQSNAEYTNLTIDELLELEYIPCGTCLPDEAEEWKELHGKE